MFIRRLAPTALVGLIALITAACGLESDGSHKSAPRSPGSASGAGDLEIGRLQTEAIRLGVARPLLLIDTATGRVLQRNILRSQQFRPGASRTIAYAADHVWDKSS